MALWRNTNGKFLAALNHLGNSELRLHSHPHFRAPELENEMLTYGEENFFSVRDDGRKHILMPIFEDNTQRQEIAQSRGYKKQPGWGHPYRRSLDSPIPDAPLPSGYIIRSMGDGVRFFWLVYQFSLQHTYKHCNKCFRLWCHWWKDESDTQGRPSLFSGCWLNPCC